jgi:hypothetical protein
MNRFMDTYWKLRLERCVRALKNNHFGAWLAENRDDARSIVMEKILPDFAVRSVSWGDSITFHATGVLNAIRKNPRITVLETFAKDLSFDEKIERRRQALLADLFFTGSNAVTEAGQLVNLDMIGNRVGGIAFGPKHVVILAGRNKLVDDVDAAMQRIRSYAAPVNAIRHANFKTPCMKTGPCMDCSRPDRICNTWTITEKSFPKERIHVILINEDLGL